MSSSKKNISKRKKHNKINNRTSNSSNYNNSKQSCNSDSYNSTNNNETSKLCAFGYVDYIVLASTIAIALGEELSQDDLSILASFFAVLSDELALIESILDCSSDDEESSVFVPPISDVAMTSNQNRKIKKNKTFIKKKK